MRAPSRIFKILRTLAQPGGARVTDKNCPTNDSGQELSGRDKSITFYSLRLSLAVTIDMILSLQKLISSSDRMSRVLSLCSERFISEPLIKSCFMTHCALGITRVCDDYKALMEALRVASFHNALGIRSFKTYLRSYGVDLTSPTFDLIRPFVYGLVRVNYAREYYDKINQILAFPLRVTLLDLSDVEQAEYDAYLQQEQLMKSWVYDAATLQELNAIVRQWFSEPPVFTSPTHSNGATAEVHRGHGATEKFRHVHATLGTSWIDLHDGHDERPIFTPYTPSCMKREKLVCKYQLVPKSYKKKRGISKEPTTHMFYQTMISKAIDKVFQRHGEIFVDQHDQRKSQVLCLRSSLNMLYGTIDLSAASDSVTKTLFDAVFDGTWVKSYGNRVRTSTVILPDGRTAKLEKYAPMGSALCFPIECVVFSAIVKLAIQRLGLDLDYRVYGDDLIVPWQVYEEVCDLLESLHFVVNRDKSYHPMCSFKEACGMEAYDGLDITPVRIPRRYKPVYSKGRPASPEQLLCLLDLANNLIKKDCAITRRLVISEIFEHYKDIPFVADPDEYGILTDHPDNSHLITRWNTELHRREILVYQPRTVTRMGDDSVNYYLTLQRYEETDRDILTPDTAIRVRSGRSGWGSSLIWTEDLSETPSGSYPILLPGPVRKLSRRHSRRP